MHGKQMLDFEKYVFTLYPAYRRIRRGKTSYSVFLIFNGGIKFNGQLNSY